MEESMSLGTVLTRKEENKKGLCLEQNSVIETYLVSDGVAFLGVDLLSQNLYFLLTIQRYEVSVANLDQFFVKLAAYVSRD